ncbi:Uncharacterized protein T310_6173 [Rasamsonia emersonii CBS 393.64]|uniref:Uncharacterized protein n=1 Tax=Rasamsonia emersonii (strain ATCC 16479 / CBS 393.64 / IMI 116815) TaxID=1408163 RepID=A0A0F4YNN1_RASE3|nr:Uncharacterized protein T310_6173 [Rasamsonia emersonii CBS 393.64]KKA19849.1 Uncharacterized protein T310_6173 [Rasamsonia emersonii CBS 393.64]
MIHWARKKAGRNAAIYGICTDSYEWAFAHIDNKSRYTRRFLHWMHGQEQEIIAQVNKIVDQAAVLAATATRRSSQSGRSVSELTHCRVSDVDDEMGDSDEPDD